ncbi:MAG: DUF4833 domain-containing protein [Azospira oryzae]|jgi:hypothetical protein|nr:MAG: DUF4833 domain-containing protein [Azospira oryzae]
MKTVIQLGILSLIAFQSHALTFSVEKNERMDTDTLPIPKGIPNMLFYVQRTLNSNTVVYELNTNDKNQLDKDNPVNIFWIRYTENKQKEDLSYIQRIYAYGLKTKKLDNNNYELRFVSYKKLPFYLTQSKDKQYHVYATIKKKQVMLTRIFIQIEGGTFWFPNVVFVEFKGIDPATGEVITERFKP